MTSDQPAPVRCTFYVREPAPNHPGQFYYRPADPASTDEASVCHLTTAYPPAIGDQLLLRITVDNRLRQCRVIGRDWLYPPPDLLNITGPQLTIVAEPTPGLFADEAPAPGEDEDGE